MAAGQVLINDKTQDKLGNDGLEEIGGHLWPIDCQTCGHALGSDPPALCVDDAMAFIAAGLHHQRCRTPAWNDEGGILMPSEATTSWRACAVQLPLTRGDKPDPRPMLLVNPSLEMVTIERDEQQRWHVRPSQLFTRAGLQPIGQVAIE